MRTWQTGIIIFHQICFAHSGVAEDSAFYCFMPCLTVNSFWWFKGL